MESPRSDYTWKKSEGKAQIVAIAIALSTKPARNCGGNSEKGVGDRFCQGEGFSEKVLDATFSMLCDALSLFFFCSDREECGVAQV